MASAQSSKTDPRPPALRRIVALFALMMTLLFAFQVGSACAEPVGGADQGVAVAASATSDARSADDGCGHPCLGCSAQCAGQCGASSATSPATVASDAPVVANATAYATPPPMALVSHEQEPLVRPPAA